MKQSYAQLGHRQQGLTLLELMLVVVIIGILAAAALPSYQRYIIRNAEMEAQSQLGSLQLELERWRTTAMSYRGFHPLNGVDATTGKSVYGYNNPENTIVYVPIGSTDSNYRYAVEILDGADFTSLSPAMTANNIAVGRSWVMRATPNPNHRTLRNRARIMLQRSDGLKCITKAGAKEDALRKTYVGTECPTPNTEKW